VIDALTARLQRVQTVVARATLEPLLVRIGVFGALVLALTVAVPFELLVTRYGLPLLLVAAIPAFAPRGAATTLAMVGIVAAWVLSTAESGERIELWRLLGLAAFLYLAHSLAALAAALPYDAVVAPEVLFRWIARALAVVLAAAVLGVVLVAVAGLGGGRTLLAAALGGLVVAVGLAGLLGWLARRRV
jgi:hypothetical protein